MGASIQMLCCFMYTVERVRSVFFQLGKKCPFEKSENHSFSPKKINFYSNGVNLWTTRFCGTLECYVIGRSVFAFYILKYLSLGDRLKNVWLVSSDRPSVEMTKVGFLGRASKTLYRKSE